MKDDILTIEEVAKYLRVSERTVYDWAQKGEIPSGKIGTVWRFKKSEIENWVNERLSGGTKPASSGNRIQVKNILSPDRIIFLNHSTKHDALIELAENLTTAPQVKDAQELSSEILKREELMSTAIGCSIAIPHVRLASVTDLVMSVGISKVDIIDFQTIDDMPVRLLFMIAAAYNQHAYYLQTLSFFSTKLKNQDLRNGLLKSSSASEAYKLLTQEDWNSASSVLAAALMS
ncbi:PTS sugar transporter subunit IIA [Treponema lecithinolyticum]|uniref:DNA binding domain, excisionase family n=2 Tax=Treponema lecithinolyticum TaxID=53418 RepID=A0ABN0NXP2_TRELE|nr:PTS sugar transporter subunit IIA [Treponema lecithinolyticum]ERJ92297.1 DNA binding domain, excisionase family [Treponema lecithinolyticum ATCC 700332]